MGKTFSYNLMVLMLLLACFKAIVILSGIDTQHTARSRFWQARDLSQPYITATVTIYDSRPGTVTVSIDVYTAIILYTLQIQIVSVQSKNTHAQAFTLQFPNLLT